MREKLLLCCPMLLLATASSADFEAGFAAYSQGDYETALAEWQPLAEQGDAGSQFGLGLLYANGFGVPMDDAQALKWYGLAADQGHAEAQYNLGVMYQNGWGVEQSDADTVKWHRLAAAGGFAEAHRSLGTLYGSGLRGERERVQPDSWDTTAAARGDESSRFKRDELQPDMQASEIAEARSRAQAWLDDFRAQHPGIELMDDD